MTSNSSRRLSTVIQSPSSNAPEEISYSSHDKHSLRGLLFPLLLFAGVWYSMKREGNWFSNLIMEAESSSPIKYTALIMVPAWVTMLLFHYITSLHLYYYWTTIKRSSETTLRLSALRSDLLQESGRLRAIAGTSGDDGVELQVWTSEASLAQLHDLLEKSDLNQLERHIGRLRDASKRLNNVTRQIDQSWDRRIFDTLQSCIARLKAVKFPWQNIYSKEGGAKPPSTAFDEEIMKDLHEAAKRVVVCPLPSVSRICDWEKSNEAQDLVDKAETAMESIQTLIGKVPESKILPGLNFNKFAVVACWEFPVPNLQKATTTTTPEIFLDNPSYDSNTPFLPFESLLGRYNRNEVRQCDLMPGGCFRGICKLKMTINTSGGIFEGYGTGWLIDASTVITAGHNLYGPYPVGLQQVDGYTSEVLVQLGVYGESANPTIEKQYGHYTAVHWGYYRTTQSRHDFAVIKLRNPFKDYVHITYEKPALTGSGVHLQVVGYPGDLKGPQDSRKGFRMFQSKGSVTYNIKQDGYMIYHTLDTYQGNSGGPILQVDPNDGSFRAIGVHCYGEAKGRLRNSGPPLGYNGNDINAFVRAINIAASGVASGPASLTSEASIVPKLKKVKVPLSTP